MKVSDFLLKDGKYECRIRPNSAYDELDKKFIDIDFVLDLIKDKLKEIIFYKQSKIAKKCLEEIRDKLIKSTRKKNKQEVKNECKIK